MEERGDSISRQVLEQKKKVARSAISSHTQASPVQTHWHFELITGYSHNPFSVSSLREYTNFTTSPSSQPICSKIVVEREEKRHARCRLRLKAGPNGGIPPQFFPPRRNERQSRNYPPFFSICRSPNVFRGIILRWKRPTFFQFNFKNQFSPIIAFKSEAEGASLWLVCHVPPFASSPPIRLLYYLADVYQGQEIISKTKTLWPIIQLP